MGRRRRGRHHLSDAQREDLLRRVAAGEVIDAVAAAFDRGRWQVYLLVARAGGLVPRRRPRPALRLSVAEREEICRGAAARRSLRAIAADLGRAPSTIAREVGANGGRRGYRAWRAERRPSDVPGGRRSPSSPASPAAAAGVERAPGAALVAAADRRPVAASTILTTPEMRVSHETIYQSLFVQGRARCAASWRAACARAGPSAGPRPASAGRGTLRDMVLISERPAEVDDRAVPGHWEGDLLIGNRSRSAIGDPGRAPDPLRAARRAARRTHRARGARPRSRTSILTLPAELRRCLTWDQGTEMAEHRASPSIPASRSTSATRTAPGSAAATRTPTGCSASTSPRAPTCSSCQAATRRRRRSSSTAVLDKRSAG